MASVACHQSSGSCSDHPGCGRSSDRGAVALAMARRGDLPGGLARIDAEHGVPRRATVAVAIVVAGYVGHEPEIGPDFPAWIDTEYFDQVTVIAFIEFRHKAGDISAIAVKFFPLQNRIENADFNIGVLID